MNREDIEDIYRKENRYADVEKKFTSRRIEVWRIFNFKHGWRWMQKESAVKLLNTGKWHSNNSVKPETIFSESEGL